MVQRRVISVAAALALLLFAGARAQGGPAQMGCCLCDCGSEVDCVGESSDCGAACAALGECDVDDFRVCDSGTFQSCGAGCRPVCTTPTATPTTTPTGTGTSTATSTPTNTPVGNGGSCVSTDQCAPGLSCVSNICVPAAEAPASSPTGLLVGAGLLLAIAALALRRQRAK